MTDLKTLATPENIEKLHRLAAGRRRHPDTRILLNALATALASAAKFEATMIEVGRALRQTSENIADLKIAALDNPEYIRGATAVREQALAFLADEASRYANVPDCRMAGCTRLPVSTDGLCGLHGTPGGAR